VRGDSVLLRRMIRNLVENAERHGRLPIEVGLEARDVVIEAKALALGTASVGLLPCGMLRVRTTGDHHEWRCSALLVVATDASELARRVVGTPVFGHDPRLLGTKPAKG
jgi:signal transduction histidine kinase